MRKLLLTSLLLVFVSAAYISCTKEQASETEVSKTENTIPISDYGFYHNEALELYYKNHGSVSGKTTAVIIEEMTADLKAKYPEKFKNVNIEEIKLAFKDVDPKKFDINLFWKSQKPGLLASNKISSKMGAFVDDVLKDDLKYEQYIAKANEFNTNSLLTSDEKDGLVIFTNVIKSSNEYWSLQINPTGKTANKPGSKVIVADTLGALMFAYSGPGAIIAGGISSLFVNEALPPMQVPVDEIGPLDPDVPANPDPIFIGE
ncbi:hypothetical protein NYQ10_11145 [Flavobacterium johnsoniae]|uniref:hypothetical protein n=1 Tax=Flavobacterium johnsoniae TaxID=986 RepID=UPI0025AEFF2D|nr:hypothetical protein [Flavobacterium johnsoniae]WJS96989.1 hypothetical protein NYQ10_11145 [Flavobacterium johnsoniae]